MQAEMYTYKRTLFLKLAHVIKHSFQIAFITLKDIRCRRHDDCNQQVSPVHFLCNRERELAINSEKSVFSAVMAFVASLEWDADEVDTNVHSQIDRMVILRHF